MATDTRVDSILFGCALAVWRNPALDAPVLNERRWKWLVVPAALAALLLCLLLRGDGFRETLRYTIQGIALTPVLVAAVRFRGWPLFRPLNLAPVAFIGVLSYSFYLVHFVVIFAAQVLLADAGALARGVVALFVSLALSWVMYRLVERPCARLRRRLTD